LRWRRVSQWHYARDCGRYTVDMINAPWSPTGRRCTAWRRGKRGEMAENLGCFDSLADAFNTCIAHLQTTGERDDDPTRVASAQ